MPCPSCVAAGTDLCESPTYSESAASGFHIRQSEDIHGMTHSLCGLVFPAKTQSAVAPELRSELCQECLSILHPEIKAAAKAVAYLDDD